MTVGASAQSFSHTRPVMWAGWAALLAIIHREFLGHSTIVHIGSYNLTTIEPAFFLAIYACIRLAAHRSPTWNAANVMGILFSGLIAIGLLRGLSINPFQAIVSLRKTGILPAFIVIATLLPRQHFFFEQLSRAIIASALVLVGLLVLRTLLGPQLFFQTGTLIAGEMSEGGRALSAQGALTIGAAVIFLWERRYRTIRTATRGRHDLTLFLCMFVALILTRQATAIAAGLVGLAGVTAFAPGRYLRVRQALLAYLALSCVVLYVVDPSIFTAESLSGLFPDWLMGDLTQRQTTLDFRKTLWAGLLADFERWSILDQVIGLPAGVKPNVFLPLWGGVYWEFGLHSMYFGLLPWAGLLGLTCYALLLVSNAIASLRTANGRPVLSGALGIGLTAMVAVYSYGYDLSNSESLFLAIAMVAGSPLSREQPTSNEISSMQPRQHG